MNRPLDLFLALAGPYPDPWEGRAQGLFIFAVIVQGLLGSANWLALPTVVSNTTDLLEPIAMGVVVIGLARLFGQQAALRRRSLSKADFSSPLKRLQRW